MTLISMLLQAPIAILVTNPRLLNNPVVACNEKFRALLECSGNKIIGQAVRIGFDNNADYFNPEILDGETANSRRAIVEIAACEEDGLLFRSAMMITAIIGADGGVAHFACSPAEPVDGSAGSAEDSGLAGYQPHGEGALSSLRREAADIAHAMRTQLTIVDCVAQRFQNLTAPIDAENITSSASRIRRAIQKMDGLLTDSAELFDKHTIS